MNNLILIFATVVFILGLVVYFMFMKNNNEGMQAFSSLSRTEPQFELIPDLASTIGGRKGYSTRCPTDIGSYGLDSQQRRHVAQGAPNILTNPRTLIKPSQIGFSNNSFVNRNVYADFYDSVGDRRRNPNFKFITKFQGINVDPVRWSQPMYRFARI